MGKMNFRFRKSYPILGKYVKFTIAKKSVSLNFNVGAWSKTIGTRGSSTTIDLPGTMGGSFRRENRLNATQREERNQNLRNGAGQFVAICLALILALVEVARLHLHPDQECVIQGHPYIVLVVLLIVHIVALRMLSGRGALKPILASIPLIFFSWMLFGALAVDKLACVSSAVG